MGNCLSGDKGPEISLEKKNVPLSKKVNHEYKRGQDAVLDEFLDDREVCGRKGEEKIELVEKIQAHLKGHMTRK